eukprot:2750288-Lingulodinium_polyedra.AAC.1
MSVSVPAPVPVPVPVSVSLSVSVCLSVSLRGQSIGPSNNRWVNKSLANQELAFFNNATKKTTAAAALWMAPRE